MAWTTPKTWASGDVLSSSDMNLHIRDNTRWLAHSSTGGAPMARLYLSDDSDIATATNTTIGSTGTWAEKFDIGGLHDSTSQRLTAPAGGGGVYLFGAQVYWEWASTGYRQIDLYDGTVRQSLDRVNGGPAIQQTVTLARLSSGGYMVARAAQASGGNLEMKGGNSPILTTFWGVWVGV